MKKTLIALALGLVMVSLIATPAFAGSKPPVPPGTPGLGAQRATFEACNTTYGTAYFNLQYPYTTDPVDPYYYIRVNVSLKTLPLAPKGSPPNTYRVTVHVTWDGGYVDFPGVYLTVSGKGNAGDAFVINPYLYCLNPDVKAFNATVKLYKNDVLWITSAPEVPLLFK